MQQRPEEKELVNFVLENYSQEGPIEYIVNDAKKLADLYHEIVDRWRTITYTKSIYIGKLAIHWTVPHKDNYSHFAIMGKHVIIKYQPKS